MTKEELLAEHKKTLIEIQQAETAYFDKYGCPPPPPPKTPEPPKAQ